MNDPEPPAPPARRVRCPGCGQPADYSPANRWRPFCSERCRSGDLGAWASDRYRLVSPAGPGADAQAPAEDGDSSG